MLFCVALRVRKTSEGLKRSPGKASKVMAQSGWRPCQPDFFVRCREKQFLFVCYLLVIIIFAFMMNEAEEGTRTQPNAFGGPSEASETQPNEFGSPSEGSETQPNAFGGPSEASETQPNGFGGPSEGSETQPKEFGGPKT